MIGIGEKVLETPVLKGEKQLTIPPMGIIQVKMETILTSNPLAQMKREPTPAWELVIMEEKVGSKE